MPQLHFIVRWPDGSRSRCYSPSTVVKDYFSPGTAYGLDDFLAKSEAALRLASERVKQKHGFYCSGAMDELAAIRAAAGKFAAYDNPTVWVEGFEP
ncbi:MSMEG_0570 family nitrogen starvation response protein [Methylogaea oryzae]|uniref:MSMEG_0570 family nitrogen starvation response protein n=1 Tax=Methylogaea oryzae TaxID=1295382 RepID=A0A8D4VN76_9GAMM|nr:MSMEG_0570 family nitrogen starvation response protein [Methylogaea oryzae]BBL70985.1 hypothetical protein MoryE10_15910 [Methylogaea oryzae]